MRSEIVLTAITPDSRHVLFVADAETDEVFESPLPSGNPRVERLK